MAMWLAMAGAAVDTMLEAGLDSRHVHFFVDRLHSATEAMLRGKARLLIHEMLEVLRTVVPAND